ncbi:hypothetical protein SOVF_080700 [Spinacia oleracea]|uniref:Elongin-A n=1 Tax=Spinacia oleracea TaxID=3562 RepID=A0A9R0I4S3_SPIOL|nr:uncharacterized protein LOC110782700 [Spinacia oleracea]XP_021842609.2 uncharacterized protein LOC110782700 [Spinacia oleracea]XP_021842610.2 uncharacterized protein LOC110782700 [Spinacia oleracea]XP_021842611.2 uncharacterized protein LOC110782700 [Spinacia oleracea]KNA17359.1 hypothetical protein SOVF_080700 [Spinacia oleracea]
MRSGYIHVSDRNRLGKGKAPSLVDLCVQTAIDNIRYIGDVGPTDSHLLEHILPHCTVEQLMHIENATSERDLSPVTDKLWKKFYEAEFGAKSVEVVVERVKKFKVTFNWRQLYQAKLKEINENVEESLERLTQSYKNESARKQSRQIQLCAKVPPSSKRRTFCGAFGESSTFTNGKSSIFKKAKAEHFNSVAMKNRAAIRKGAVQQPRSNNVSRPQIAPGKGVNSYSKLPKKW